MNYRRIEYVKKSPIFKKWEIIITVIIYVILISVCAFLLLRNVDGNRVNVYCDGELIYSGALSQDHMIDIEGKCRVVIESGYVYVVDSTCSNGLCEQCGKINKVYQRIICVPNRVLIEISGEGRDVDAIT